MGKMLVVDSSLLDRKRIGNILEAAGHTVLECSAPAEAIGELQGLPPGTVDMILTELHFSEGSGLDLIGWVKEQETWSAVPLLVITAQPPREQVIELVLAGASTIVTKPFGADLLLRRVTTTLAQQTLLRQGEDSHLSWQLFDYVRRELKRSDRTGEPFSVLVCRVLDLKGGRAVPLLMAGLAPTMRESDILARLGEDQLVLLLPDTDAVGAWAVEERIGRVAAAFEVPVSVATGAATYPAEARDGDVLMALAQDRALRHSS
ncbi:MAG TPA: response regulator [Symbiobacteriaceae bacterium]|jgi:PleD family two-component response regulator|nr:response regulator [Symbiobacteriaceae bacterium]